MLWLLVLCCPFSLGSTSADSRPATPPRGYSHPPPGPRGQTGRQVVVDREKGQYLGHPTTVLLEDNRTMLIVYPKGHGSGPIVFKRSSDGGLTWSDRLPVPENWATSQETPTIHRVVGRRGQEAPDHVLRPVPDQDGRLRR